MIREIMNNFFRRVRKRMMEIEVQRGRPLLLGVRVFDTEELSLEAAENCPVAAITVTDSDTGEQLFP